MKELATRAVSGTIYVSLLIISLFTQLSFFIILIIFGLICMAEFTKLIELKSKLSYIIFLVLYTGFGYWVLYTPYMVHSEDAIQIFLVTTIFVNLILVKDLLSERSIPLFESKRFITVTFYLTSGFVFMLLIANYQNKFTPLLLLGCLILVWVNDSFAYLVGKNFGKQKLFPKISPKKTVEGFAGGVFMTLLLAYLMSFQFDFLTSVQWIGIAVLIICKKVDLNKS